MENLIRVYLKIDNMHCKSCERLIKESLSQINGTENINVSYENEIAEIELNPTKTSVNAIIKKIEEMGYEAKEVCDPNVKNTKKSNGFLSNLFGRK
ncbi:MAG: heavy metal-associated domain-containing protein [Candidatus Micrarchaeia archaeon]